jgi:hypothetical protein
MGAVSGRKLTRRQLAVLERIDRRVPIKVIAMELGVSETRINQHIRALKDSYRVDSLNELVRCYRAEYGDGADTAPSEPDLAAAAFSDSAYKKNQIAGRVLATTGSPRVDPGEIVLSDVMPLIGDAPWQVANEPRIVPGLLDGEHAVLIRLAAIVGIAFGMLAAVVLAVTAAMSLSEVLDGRAHVPVEELSLAG